VYLRTETLKSSWSPSSPGKNDAELDHQFSCRRRLGGFPSIQHVVIKQLTEQALWRTTCLTFRHDIRKLCFGTGRLVTSGCDINSCLFPSAAGLQGRATNRQPRPEGWGWPSNERKPNQVGKPAYKLLPVVPSNPSFLLGHPSG
jgi:hypothetical protein